MFLMSIRFLSARHKDDYYHYHDHDHDAAEYEPFKVVPRSSQDRLNTQGAAGRAAPVPTAPSAITGPPLPAASRSRCKQFLCSSCFLLTLILWTSASAFKSCLDRYQRY